MSSVTVVSIVGASRSGSTLLSRMLGAQQGWVNVGELTYLWDRGLRENRLCGCGRPFRSCALWSTILDEAFGGPDAVDVDRMLHLRAVLQRGAARLRWAVGAPSGSMRSALAEYGDSLLRLLEALRSHAGARVIVDASKLPTHSLAMARIEDVELHPIHLVRDPRAVAHSWSQIRQSRDHRDPGDEMPRYGPVRSATMFWTGSLGAGLLMRRSDGGSRIRYEDLAARPAAELPRLIKRIELAARPTLPDSDGTMELGAQCSISGNPMRMEVGPVSIRPDQAWRDTMPVRSRALVTALTWPLLAHYGYSPRDRQGSVTGG